MKKIENFSLKSRLGGIISISIIIFTQTVLAPMGFVYSQNITWQRIYPFPSASIDISFLDFSRTDNNNFYLIGRIDIYPHVNYILKINEFGDTLWSKILDTPYVKVGTSSSDGGCVLACSNGTIIKLNSSGNIIWSKLYGTAYNKIIRTSANNYALCGSGNYQRLIIIIDSSGNLIWEKQYFAPYGSYFSSICEAYNNGYVAVGNWSDGKAVIDRVDNNGNLIWEKKESQPGMTISAFNAIVHFNGGYILTADALGSLFQHKECIFLLRIDSSGNELITNYYHSIDTTLKAVPCDLNVINSNKVLITGVISSDTGIYSDTTSLHIYPLIIIADSIGNIERYKILQDAKYSFFGRSFVISENSYIFAGGYGPYLNSTSKFYSARIDSSFQFPPIEIKKISQNLPVNFQLFQNYPNPFNPSTNIKYQIPKTSYVKITVCDILGKEITILVNEKHRAGNYEIKWDASKYASGVYFYRIEAGNFIDVKKMVLIK